MLSKKMGNLLSFRPWSTIAHMSSPVPENLFYWPWPIHSVEVAGAFQHCFVLVLVHIAFDEIGHFLGCSIRPNFVLIRPCCQDYMQHCQSCLLFIITPVGSTKIIYTVHIIKRHTRKPILPVLPWVDRRRLTTEWVPTGGRKTAVWSRQRVYRYVHWGTHRYTIYSSYHFQSAYSSIHTK